MGLGVAFRAKSPSVSFWCSSADGAVGKQSESTNRVGCQGAVFATVLYAGKEIAQHLRCLGAGSVLSILGTSRGSG